MWPFNVYIPRDLHKFWGCYDVSPPLAFGVRQLFPVG